MKIASRLRFPLALALTFCSGLGLAQETRVVGWGDSMTYAPYDFPNGSPPNDCYDGHPANDPSEDCGHVARLDSRLNSESPSWEIEVLNLGKEGEDTVEALSRIGNPGTTCGSPAINSLKYWVCSGWSQPDDLFLLMEGTNDISVGIGRETTKFNLEMLGQRAEGFGFLVVIATLIPRHYDACVDPDNVLNQQRNADIAELSATHGWPLVDTYARLWALRNSGLFNQYYQNWDPMCEPGGDPVGHINDRGYDKVTWDAGQVYYEVTFEARVMGELPPRLTLAAPAPPIETGVAETFSVTLHDLATTADLWWDFGDGRGPTRTVPAASPATLDHVYLVPGPYTVRVTAEHPNGSEREATVQITVTGADLTIFADGFESGDTSAWSSTSP